MHLLGALVTHAMEHHDVAAARHAITLGTDLPLAGWVPAVRAYANYTLANAHDVVRSTEAKRPADAWSWSADFDASLLRLRQAANDEGFEQLPRTHRCQILTNLGNELSTIGRAIEALENWNHALTIDSDFSMARANRGHGIIVYASALYDAGHRGVFHWLAYHDLATAIPSIPYADAQRFFIDLRNQVVGRYSADKLAETPRFDEFSLGDSPDEIAYRTWCLRNRLFLNPLNDVLTESIAGNDVLLTPSIVVPLGEPPLLQGFYNQLKQEFATARFLLYQGLHRLAPRFADNGVRLWNTLDYPSYGSSVEFTKLAYRAAFSLFDKVAYFLNHYLALGIPEKRVSFQTLWYETQDRRKGLKACFANRPNLPLRGLFWLSRDLDKNADRQLALDAEQLATIRHHLEHKYLKAHEPDWILAKGDPLRTDTLAENIGRTTLEAKALRVMTLARAALIYLTLAVHIEERERATTRGNGKIPGMPLDLYDDSWKNADR